MIPTSSLFDPSTIAALLAHDPLVQAYRTLFSLLDWSVVDRWQAQRTGRGSPAHPEHAYLKSFLIRLNEGLLYATQLRTFLLNHPLLVIELGFHLVLDSSAPFGFDIDQTLPCRFWFSEKLRRADSGLLHDLFSATVSSLAECIPGLGEIVAFDVKHIYAWVKENNPRVYTSNRYDKTRILAGDPDCTLGVKRSTNQEHPDGSTGERKELLWGYGSGVAAATAPDYGDVVLAEHTQPFNTSDVSYFRPLYQKMALSLHQFPRHFTANAAFDAWYVYEAATRHGGIAAIPRNQHGHILYTRQQDGTPLCPISLPMHPTYSLQHTYGYRAQRFRCPLLYPHSTGTRCDHPQFQKGKGCVKDVNMQK